MQKYMRQALSLCEFEPEYYNRELLEKNQLISEREAVETIHFPDDYDSMIKARKRLVFNEFFTFLFLMRKNKEFR